MSIVYVRTDAKIQPFKKCKSKQLPRRIMLKIAKLIKLISRTVQYFYTCSKETNYDKKVFFR